MAEKPYIIFANQLRKEILSGKYGTEGGLPGIEELKRRSGLAANTIYKSLALLQGERLITERDKAFYVTALPSMLMTQHVPPLHIRMQAQGRVSFARNVADVERMQVPDEIADRAKVPHGTMAVHRLRVLGEVKDSKEIPSRLVEYYYLLDLTDEQIRKMREDATLHILLETGPVEMVRHDDICARLPTSDEITLLGIPETTPVLYVQVTNRDMDGKAILTQNVVLTPAGSVSYEYTFENRPR